MESKLRHRSVRVFDGHVRWGQLAQIDRRYSHVPRRRNKLHRVSVNHTKSSPQNFMAPHEERETAGQGVDIQGAMDAECGRNIVIPTVRSNLVKQPETLLTERRGENKLAGAVESGKTRNTHGRVV